MRKLAAFALAWGVTVAGALSLNALLSWVLWQTGAWNDRVRTNRFDPLRELRRFVEALLSLGLAGALAGRTSWPRWVAASVLLLWPLRIVAELRTAAVVSHRPHDTLALHERGFLADTYGPLPTRGWRNNQALRAWRCRRAIVFLMHRAPRASPEVPGPARW